MKIPNKRELQQIALNLLILKLLLKFIKNALKNHTLFWLMIQPFNQVILYGLDIIFLVNIIIEIMTIDDQIKDEKLQYNINREAAKI